MIYVAALLLVLVLLFDLSVWVWLRANPVPPLAEIPDWRVARTRPAPFDPYAAAWGVTASSAWAVVPALTASYPDRLRRVPAGYRDTY